MIGHFVFFHFDTVKFLQKSIHNQTRQTLSAISRCVPFFDFFYKRVTVFSVENIGCHTRLNAMMKKYLRMKPHMPVFTISPFGGWIQRKRQNVMHLSEWIPIRLWKWNRFVFYFRTIFLNFDFFQRRQASLGAMASKAIFGLTFSFRTLFCKWNYQHGRLHETFFEIFFDSNQKQFNHESIRVFLYENGFHFKFGDYRFFRAFFSLS